jgi:trimethylamine--corrinoid protein Co-methyltransferase
MPDIQPIRSRLHLEVLSPAELAEIKSATLDILQNIGVRFPSRRALQIFNDRGAQVDEDSAVVKLSPDLVLGAMRHAPRSYTLAGRGNTTALHLDGSASYFGTDGCGVETIDFETG